MPSYPAYLAVYSLVLVIAGLSAAVGMVAGRRRRLAEIGWTLGSLVSVVSVVTYLVGRTVGVPGLPQLRGWWDYPIGTFSMALAVLFVALHFSVRTGMNVAYPERKQWHD